MAEMHSPRPVSPRYIDMLGMEAAFLIVTAASRDFDLSKWFNEKAYDGKIPVREFDAKMLSLATAMGINQSLEIKRELEIATSPVSMRMVHKICGVGEDVNGELLIDLHLLFKLSQQKVDKYMREIQSEQEERHQDFRQWEDGAYDIQGNLLPPLSTQREDEEEMKGQEQGQPSSPAAKQYLSEIKEISESGARPVSAHAGGRALARGEGVEEMLTGERKVKNHRYDEEIDVQTIEYGDIYDEEKGESALPNPPAAGASSPQPPLPPPLSNGEADWMAENHRLLTPSRTKHTSFSSLHAPTHSSLRSSLSLSRMRSLSPSKLQLQPGRYFSAQPARTRSRSVDAELRRLAHISSHSFLTNLLEGAEEGERGRRAGQRSVERRGEKKKRKSIEALSLDPHQLSAGKEVLQERLRKVVQQADLYHLLQVQLGYLPHYTLIPPRGSIVISTPSAYLSLDQIYTAFLTARLYLNKIYLQMVPLLVADFSLLYSSLYPSLPVVQGEVVVKGEVHAEWMKKYLLHLRLTKLSPSALSTPSALPPSVPPSSTLPTPPASARASVPAKPPKPPQPPLPWQAWLERKLEREVSLHPYRPRELRRALQGLPHSLQEGEVKRLLQPRGVEKKRRGVGGESDEEEDEESEEYSDDFDTERKGERKTRGRGKGGVGGSMEREEGEVGDILPPHFLSQEIENKVRLWQLDSEASRDFAHHLNIRLRSTLLSFLDKKDKPVSAQNKKDALYPIVNRLAKEYNQLKSQANRPGPLSELSLYLWQHLPAEQKKHLKNTLTHTLCEEKRVYYQTQERTERLLSVQLFTLFLAHNKEKEQMGGQMVTWVQYLEDFLNKQKSHIEKLENLYALQLDQCRNVKLMKESMTSLVLLENMVKKLMDVMSIDVQLELQKGLLVLRKLAQEKALGYVVTKQDFLQVISPILSSYIPTSNHINAANKQVHEMYQKILALFAHEQDASATVEQVLHAEDEKNKKNEKEYTQWLFEKNEKLKETKRKEREREAREKAEEEEKKQKAEKAYKKWMKLRKRNQYKSKMEKKPLAVPQAKPAQHSDKWRRDTVEM